MLGYSPVPLQIEPQGTQRLRPNFGQTGGAAVAGHVYTVGGSSPLTSHTPCPIKRYLLGPDSLFLDYLVVVVVGSKKRKMFIFPKQHGT